MSRELTHIFGLFVCLFGFITQNAKRLLQQQWLYSSYWPKHFIRSKILSLPPLALGRTWEEYGSNITEQ